MTRKWSTYSACLKYFFLSGVECIDGNSQILTANHNFIYLCPKYLPFSKNLHKWLGPCNSLSYAHESTTHLGHDVQTLNPSTQRQRQTDLSEFWEFRGVRATYWYAVSKKTYQNKTKSKVPHSLSMALPSPWHYTSLFCMRRQCMMNTENG